MHSFELTRPGDASEAIHLARYAKRHRARTSNL